MCEPITDPPQKLDDLFPKKPEKTEHEDDFSENNALELKYEADYFRVLPLLSFKNRHLKQLLSVQRNEYIRCRYQQFVQNIPDHYVKICLYKDFYKKAAGPVRRKILNGEFYGVDNKLAPVPYFPDPRKIETKPRASVYRK